LVTCEIVPFPPDPVDLIKMSSLMVSSDTGPNVVDICWDPVLGIVRKISSAAGHFPGPIATPMHKVSETWTETGGLAMASVIPKAAVSIVGAPEIVATR
jgi:hypothetical protein